MELRSRPDDVVIPGDVVGEISAVKEEDAVSLRLGAGLSQKKEVRLSCARAALVLTGLGDSL